MNITGSFFTLNNGSGLYAVNSRVGITYSQFYENLNRYVLLLPVMLDLYYGSDNFTSDISMHSSGSVVSNWNQVTTTSNDSFHCNDCDRAYCPAVTTLDWYACDVYLDC